MTRSAIAFAAVLFAWAVIVLAETMYEAGYRDGFNAAVEMLE